MKKIIVPLLAIVALLLMIAWMAGAFTEKITPGVGDIDQLSTGEPVTVQVAEVAVIEKVPATVEATQATLISARLMARIVAINVRAGDSVKKGDLLLELESSDLEAQVRQAEAQVRATSAHLEEAKKNLERAVELASSGVVSAAQLDRARANNQSLTAELTAAEQAREEANTALSYARIVAPFDGRVVDRFAEPGDTAQPGSQLLALYNPLTLRVEAQVREHLALNLEVGRELQVEIPSLEKVVDAVVEERVPAADPGSRSFLVKAGVAFDRGMLPGMYARLLVPAGTGRQLLIPADSVVHVGQLDMVRVYRDGQAHRRFVRVGNVTDDGHVEVLSGLTEGEQILTVR